MSILKNDNKYLIYDKPWKGIVKFTIPLFLGTIVQQVYSISDAAIAGHFIGANALAAVGANSPFIQLGIALFFGLSIGANILISQNYGAENKGAVSDTIDTFMIMIYISSFVFTIFIFLLSKYIHQSLLKTPDEILSSSLIYMNTLLIGTLGIFGYNGISASLRAVGDSRTPLMLLIISNIINIILNILFVAVFNWGVMGLALATSIAQILSFIFGIIFINTKNKTIKIHFFNSKFKLHILKDFMLIGLPAGIQGTFISIGMFAIQSLINRFGVVTIAGYNSAVRIELFVSSIAMNFGQTLSIFIAQNIGAGKWDRIKVGVRSTLIMSVSISGIIGIIIFIFCEYILLLFTKDLFVIAEGARYLRILSPFYTVAAFLFVLVGGIRGSGATLMPMVISAIGQLVLRIPLAYIFVYILKSSDGIWIAMPISWLNGCILAWIYYKSNRWKKYARVSKSIIEAEI